MFLCRLLTLQNVLSIYLFFNIRYFNNLFIDNVTILYILNSIIFCHSNRISQCLKIEQYDQCRILDRSLLNVTVSNNKIYFFASIPSHNTQEPKPISRLCTVKKIKQSALLGCTAYCYWTTSLSSKSHSYVRHTLTVTPTRRVFRTRFPFVSGNITPRYLCMYNVHYSSFMIIHFYSTDI